MKNTYKDASVVDYVVVSLNLMPSITKFKICEFNNISTDVHSAVVADINVNFNGELLNEYDNASDDIDVEKPSKFIRWNIDVMSFKDNIDLED